jgi:uncharacterized membrane protein YhaH (DUF805 family)
MFEPQRGLVSFIRMKLKAEIAPVEIKRMLLKAGFTEDHIDQAFRYVKEKFQDSHLAIEASHDFLPHLVKGLPEEGVQLGTNPVLPPIEQKTATQASESILVKLSSQSMAAPVAHGVKQFTKVHKQFVESHKAQVEYIGNAVRNEMSKHFKVHKGLFQGRLRRKDFILGFLFFFAVGYVALSLSAVTISLFAPSLWGALLNVIEMDTTGVLLLAVPVILAPITIMMLSLVTRRFHNLGLPGSLSWLFLVLFIPLDVRVFSGMWFAYTALCVLFVLLLAKKGDPKDNEYGPFPESKGSFFKRIFNV